MTAVAGVSVPSEVRVLVLDRDGYRCCCCRVPVAGREYGLAPRLPLADGGRLSPENLVTLLDACRDRIDASTVEATGLRLQPGQDPALEPVALLPEVRAWLGRDGRYHFEPPAEVVA